jgi:hypothetical protein
MRAAGRIDPEGDAQGYWVPEDFTSKPGGDETGMVIKAAIVVGQKPASQ